MPTNLDLTKRALAEIGTRTTITSMAGAQPEAVYASLLYNPLRDFLLREGDYDWSMKQATLVAAANAATFPWSFAYPYPADAIRIRQLITIGALANDPKPVEWNVLNWSGARQIWTRTASNSVLYTFAPVEDVWDAIFTESFVRLLGSALAFALENRIEASQVKLNEAISFAGIANLRDS